MKGAGFAILALALLAALPAARAAEIHAAAQAGDVGQVRALLAAGEDVNQPGGDGPPLLVATRANRIEIVRLLLAQGAAVNAKDSRNGRTALHVATLDGSSELASLLIASGADVDALDRAGRTPLNHATQQGATEIAALLIDNGARSDDITRTGIRITGEETGEIAALPQVRTSPALPQLRSSQDTRELAFWNSIKDSTFAADFQTYLDAFPNGTFVPLARSRAQALVAAVEQPPAAAPAPAPVEDGTAADLAYWNSIKDSADPADFQAYVDAFPNGTFAPLARARARPVVASVEQPPAAAPPAPAPVQDDAAAELAFWNSIKDSTYAADFQAYLDAYPNGTLAPLARARVQSLAAAAKQPPAPTPVRDDTAADLAFWNSIKDSADPADFQAYVNAFPNGTFAPLARVRAGARAQPPAVSRPAPAQVAAAAPRAAAETSAPRAPREAEVSFQDCDACPKMVSVTAGDFIMGDNRGDATQRPAHHVTIYRDFAIGRFEVTVREWKACVAGGGCSDVPRIAEFADDTPIRNVSWDDAQEYIRWLSRLTGRSYRLPTEAEWEYAARSGTESRYWWGDDVRVGLVACRNCGGEWSSASPGSVGSFDPNPFGLFDMNGSVAEWTADCWEGNFNSARSDGTAVTRSNCRQRVLRGGSWRNTNPDQLASTNRFFYDAPVRYITNGFRVAAD